MIWVGVALLGVVIVGALVTFAAWCFDLMAREPLPPGTKATRRPW